jgi:glucosamine--fructose-6-phosphate aminotransferase (isomerizing)
MCGIVGYVGPNSSLDVLIAGLSRLEYRGYDSAGVAVIGEDGKIGTRKRAGKLKVLVGDLEGAPLADGKTGIGHTRWATHTRTSVTTANLR